MACLQQKNTGVATTSMATCEAYCVQEKPIVVTRGGVWSEGMSSGAVGRSKRCMWTSGSEGKSGM